MGKEGCIAGVVGGIVILVLAGFLTKPIGEATQDPFLAICLAPIAAIVLFTLALSAFKK